MGKKAKAIRHLIIVLIILIISPFIVFNYFLPSKISVIEGQRHSFKLKLPLEASILPADMGVLKVNNKPINNNNIKINLSKPFTMEISDLDKLNIKLSLFGLINIKKLEVKVLPKVNIVPCGNTVGVKLLTDGIMVLGTGLVKGEDDKLYEPGKGILQSGDIIVEINDKKLDSKEDLMGIILKSDFIPLKIKINRDNEIIYDFIQPIYSKEDKEYKIGVWVRDSTQGIGTITYYNPSTKAFGALGHGITDVDTNKIMSVKQGVITKSTVTSIKKGKKGVPGELKGTISGESECIIGEICKNTHQGIYGNIYDEGIELLNNKAMPIGLQDEVTEGEAYILSNISGDKVEKFKVDIQKVSRYKNDISKGMVVKIVDKRLLESTNGIVQGMSGSPIIQNNKIIGAITHVFIQDPTKGYGIFIENMIKNEIR